MALHDVLKIFRGPVATLFLEQDIRAEFPDRKLPFEFSRAFDHAKSKCFRGLVGRLGFWLGRAKLYRVISGSFVDSLFETRSIDEQTLVGGVEVRVYDGAVSVVR